MDVGEVVCGAGGLNKLGMLTQRALLMFTDSHFK